MKKLILLLLAGLLLAPSEMFADKYNSKEAVGGEVPESLIVSPEIEVTSVEVYRNGTQIIAETIPTLFYDLSSYGSGEYTIQVTTVIEITYIGHFIIN